MRKNKDGFQQQIFDGIQKYAGNINMLTIPQSIMRYTSNLSTAVFLGQLIYWCDKGKSPDGYIFKTYQEWTQETLLSQYQIRKATKKLVAMGILHTKKRKANGSPTIYYKLDRHAFTHAFFNFLRMESENISNRNQNIATSLTEPTADPSPEHTLEKEKGAKSFDIRSIPLSFLSFRKKNEINLDVSEAIGYFLKQYQKYMGEEHPALKLDQWLSVVSVMSQCAYDAGLERFLGVDITFDELKIMIDSYFDKTYQDGCDHRLLHFTSSGVFTNLYYEKLY
jgi:hypothetical protein